MTFKPMQNLDNALAACLDDLAAGRSLTESLARYPEYAADLAPLLQTADSVRSEPRPTLSLRGRVAGRERMHAALTLSLIHI